MKNTKNLIWIMFAMLIVLSITACGEATGDYGMVTVTRDSIKVNNETVYNVHGGAINNSYDGDFLAWLQDFTNPVSFVSGGKLTVNLGIPTELNNFYLPGDNITISDSSVKMRRLNSIANGVSAPYQSLFLDKDHGSNEINFIYVDKAVVINGFIQWNETYIERYNNLSLQPGWNTIISISIWDSDTTTRTYKNGTPDSTYRWNLWFITPPN